MSHWSFFVLEDELKRLLACHDLQIENRNAMALKKRLMSAYVTKGTLISAID